MTYRTFTSYNWVLVLVLGLTNCSESPSSKPTESPRDASTSVQTSGPVTSGPVVTSGAGSTAIATETNAQLDPDTNSGPFGGETSVTDPTAGEVAAGDSAASAPSAFADSSTSVVTGQQTTNSTVTSPPQQTESEDATTTTETTETHTSGPELPPFQQSAEPISFGTSLEPAEVMAAARQRAATTSDAGSPTWRATGDQHRTYYFDETATQEPYRLFVPTQWDKQSKLPLVMFLHGGGSDENTYVDQNEKQLLGLAQEHQFILVSPRGVAGAYGNFLRLSAPFGNPQAAAELMSMVTPESLRANELSEMDVINVLERVLAEYPVDHAAMFLTGHSMGSGGTWYIGGKYSTYWRALAPMSGPFVQETGYPWQNLQDIGVFVSEGLQTPSLDGSRLLAEWLSTNGFDSEYVEVDADHGAMVPLVLPQVFDYFDGTR